ncbi:MAG: mechanosensitive ion channel family protein [Pleurocapsa sp.]
MSLEFLKEQFLNNQISDYLIALIIFSAVVIVVRLLRRLVFQRLKNWAAKTPTTLDDHLVRITEKYSIPIIYLGGFYLSVTNLVLHPILDTTIEAILIILTTILGVKLINSLIKYLLRLYCVTNYRNNLNFESSINALLPAIRTVIWAIGILFLLDNLGFNVSAIVASLGIGGVAVALASQGVLQDLFSYFAILFDRPFELGDFIIVAEYMGTVEYVGIKTTRIKSLDGEEIIIANRDLTDSRIRNYKRMKQRRIVFHLGIVYQTDKEQLAAIPTIIENIIQQTDNATFDRAHFCAYKEFSLDYEVVYFVEGNNYTRYMDVQQEINLKIKQEFDKQSIGFAYPVQVNYLRGHLNFNDNMQNVEHSFKLNNQ